MHVTNDQNENERNERWIQWFRIASGSRQIAGPMQWREGERQRKIKREKQLNWIVRCTSAVLFPSQFAHLQHRSTRGKSQIFSRHPFRCCCGSNICELRTQACREEMHGNERAQRLIYEWMHTVSRCNLEDWLLHFSGGNSQFFVFNKSSLKAISIQLGRPSERAMSENEKQHQIVYSCIEPMKQHSKAVASNLCVYKLKEFSAGVSDAWPKHIVEDNVHFEFFSFAFNEKNFESKSLFLIEAPTSSTIEIRASIVCSVITNPSQWLDSLLFPFPTKHVAPSTPFNGFVLWEHFGACNKCVADRRSRSRQCKKLDSIKCIFINNSYVKWLWLQKIHTHSPLAYRNSFAQSVGLLGCVERQWETKRRKRQNNKNRPELLFKDQNSLQIYIVRCE